MCAQFGDGFESLCSGHALLDQPAAYDGTRASVSASAVQVDWVTFFDRCRYGV